MTTDQQAVTRTSFKMGADIPDWLLVIEPASPQAVKKNFRFGTDVDLFDTPEFYLVLPTSIAHANPVLIDLEGTWGCNILAASKPVWMVHGRSITFASDVDARKMAEALGPGALRHAPQIFDTSAAPWTPALLADAQKAAMEREGRLFEEALDRETFKQLTRRSFWQRLGDLFRP